MTDRELAAARYVAGCCVDCGEREHSAGRPRCEGCHAAYMRGDQSITTEVSA